MGPKPTPPRLLPMSTRRDGSATPSAGWSRSALATVKIVVLAPIPMASESVPVIVRTGFRRSSRAACTRSRRASVNHTNERVLKSIDVAPGEECEDHLDSTKTTSGSDPFRLARRKGIREIHVAALSPVNGGRYAQLIARDKRRSVDGPA